MSGQRDWCPGLESNQHGFYPTRSLVWRVYQFRHPGTGVSTGDG